MRKLSFLIVIIATFVMTACSVKIPYRYSMNYIDYNAVSQQYGVFITESNSVGFDYQPIGSISLMERSGNEVKSGESETEAKDGVYSKSLITTVKYGDWIDASIDELLKIACQKAIEQGGNGIINMKIEYLPSTVVNNVVYSEGYRITGMIIKR